MIHWCFGVGGTRSDRRVDQPGGPIVALARQACIAYPEIHVRQANALSLPYSDDQFDLRSHRWCSTTMEGPDADCACSANCIGVARRDRRGERPARGRWPLWVTWAAVHLVSRSRTIPATTVPSPCGGIAFLPAELLTLAREAGWGRRTCRGMRSFAWP